MMDLVVKSFLILAIAGAYMFCQELPMNYNARSVAGAGAGMCPDTQNLWERISRDTYTLINSSVMSLFDPVPGHGTCGCGGPGWRRAAYLDIDMSDLTQTCHQHWELITTPRRSCARSSNAI